MKRPAFIPLMLSLAVISCSALQGSEEEFLGWRSVKVECIGTSETGTVSVEARVNDKGITSFDVTAFGRSFSLEQSDLDKIRSFPLASLKITHEAGYPQLGGHTVNFRLRLTYYDKEHKLHEEDAWVSISKGKGLTVTTRNSQPGN